MLLFQHLVVTNQKDKFYAFRSLHTAAGDLPAPDYTKSNEDVFTELAAWILEDTRSLMLLALDLHDGPELPSWVPNFSTKPPIEPNYWRSRLTLLGTYDCAKGLDWSVEHLLPGDLRLRGMVVDRIKDAASDAFAFKGTTEHAEFLREWYAFASGGSYLLSFGQLFDEAFSETMIAGCAEDDTGIHKAHAVDLAEWKDRLTRLMQDASLGDDATSSRLMASHITAVLNRRLFRTCAGRLGVGPSSLRSGDPIWIFGGGKAPFILRHAPWTQSGEREYVLVGHAYVHGIMQGQAVDQKLEIQQCQLT